MITINVKLPQEQIERIDGRINSNVERLDKAMAELRSSCDYSHTITQLIEANRELEDRVHRLYDRVQHLYLENALQIAALLEHFERQQKAALEFVPIEAVAAKVEVRRRKESE